MALRGIENAALMTCGTDGIDGPTDAAGAIVTGETIVRGERAGLSAEDALAANDSYNYLRAVDALVFTGLTGTNVGDVTNGLLYSDSD